MPSCADEFLVRPHRNTSALLVLLAMTHLSAPPPLHAGVRPKRSAPALRVRLGVQATVRGEVVSFPSYVRDGRRGEVAATEGGDQPALPPPYAILEENTGTLYLLGTREPATDPNLAVKDLLGKHVLVEGSVFERAGAQMLVIERIEKLGP